MTKTSKTKTAGDKIGSLRKKKHISLEELSQKTGLTLSHLKNIEEGKEFAPVGDILKISRVLTINPEELFTPGKRNGKDLKEKRVEDFKIREESYHYTVLTPEGKDKHLRAFRVVIPPRSEHPKISYRHDGEEFVYVLTGEVIIQVGQKKHHLKKDDTLHFDSGITHSLKNPGGKETVLIVTIYSL
jgi:quercetin dioxygenase-like cupin family protein